MKNKNGDRIKIETVDFPRPCKYCDDDVKRDFGCGFDDGYYGKGKYEFGKLEKGETHELKIGLCPQFCARTIFYNSIAEYYEDYKRGALGPIWNLPSSLYDYLRIFDLEITIWLNEQRESVS